MIPFLEVLVTPFILGLLTPLTAVCVLPLYPAFLAYLTSQASKSEDVGAQKKTLAILGFLIVAGVLLFMFVLGLVFTTILEVSLTKVIGIISPFAFGFLLVISLLLIFNVDIGKFIPKTKTPKFKNPFLNALAFGFFFGAIIIPCSPLFIAALFATTANTADFLLNMIQFLSFGLGIGAPLLAFSILSLAVSDKVIGVFVKYQKPINVISGIIMFSISAYYLIYVFKIFS